MSRLDERRIVAIFGIVLLGLALNGAVSYQATLRMIENERWVAHSHEVLAEIERTLSSLRATETGQRGYILTGDPAYLQPYLTALPEIAGHLESLRRLTADNPGQQARIAMLREQAASRLTEIQRVLDVYRSGGLEAARREIQAGKGRRRMEALRVTVAQIEAEEARLLARRSAESRASGRSALLTLTVANLLLLGSVFGVSWLVVRDARGRRQREAELQAAHNLLETRVAERTSELATANERLQRFTRELERSNRELQDFAFVASHDLQEPLRKIQAFGDRLKGKYGAALADEARDYLERMQAAAQRMHVLINDLLTFSRITSKAQPFVPVDLEQVAREVLSDLEVRIQQSGARVETAGLPTLDADPLQMRQLFQNLVGNALKFHRPGVPPTVRVAGEVADGRARLTFEDDGIGFDMKYLDRIFTPFQRLHTRSEYEGTGMGLAVCRRIIERHGGTIDAESAPGRGSRFLVTLPLRHSLEEQSA